MQRGTDEVVAKPRTAMWHRLVQVVWMNDTRFLFVFAVFASPCYCQSLRLGIDDSLLICFMFYLIHLVLDLHLWTNRVVHDGTMITGSVALRCSFLLLAFVFSR